MAALKKQQQELVSGALVIASRIELLNSQTEKHTKTIAASEFVIAVCLCDYVWEQKKRMTMTL